MHRGGENRDFVARESHQAVRGLRARARRHAGHIDVIQFGIGGKRGFYQTRRALCHQMTRVGHRVIDLETQRRDSIRSVGKVDRRDLDIEQTKRQRFGRQNPRQIGFGFGQKQARPFAQRLRFGLARVCAGGNRAIGVDAQSWDALAFLQRRTSGRGRARRQRVGRRQRDTPRQL